MKVLVTGVNGQLGHDVFLELNNRNIKAIGTGRQRMDITKAAEVEAVVSYEKPDAIIHCAAYTAVDLAEEEQELCCQVNGVGTANIASVCKNMDIPMVYVSTDYVFNGQGSHPWQPDDILEPLNVYGLSKARGEEAVRTLLDKYYIVRTSWVYGLNGKNFVRTMLKLGKSAKSISVVADQIGSPTYTPDLAKLLVDMVESDRYGIYHASNEGFCSWYEFACEIFRQSAIKIEVLPVESSQYPAKAKRPGNSRLNKDKLEQNGFQRLPDWRDALMRFLDELKYEEAGYGEN